MPFQIAERVADALLIDALLRPGRDPFAVTALAPRSGDGAGSCVEARWLVRRHAGRVDVRLRFLQHERKTIEAIAGVDLVTVDGLDLGDARAISTEELAQVRRDYSFTLADIGPHGLVLAFDAPGELASETLRRGDVVVGRAVRRKTELHGLVRVFLEAVDGDDALARLVVRVENTTPYVPMLSGDGADARALATLHAVHLIAESEAGAFLSTSDAAHPGNTILTTLVLGGAGAGGLVLSAPFPDQVVPDEPAAASTPTRVLVAAVGDALYGDDGVGRAILERLRAERLPRGVALVDCGASALELVEHLAQTPELLVLVGAVARGGPAGTVYAVDAALLDDKLHDQKPSTPAAVVTAIRELVATPPAIKVVGVEPLTMTEGRPLSTTVEQAVASAASLVRDVVGHALGREEIAASSRAEAHVE